MNGQIKLKKDAIPTINSSSQHEKFQKIKLKFDSIKNVHISPSKYGFEIIAEFQDEECVNLELLNEMYNQECLTQSHNFQSLDTTSTDLADSELFTYSPFIENSDLVAQEIQIDYVQLLDKSFTQPPLIESSDLVAQEIPIDYVQLLDRSFTQPPFIESSDLVEQEMEIDYVQLSDKSFTHPPFIEASDLVTKETKINYVQLLDQSLTDFFDLELITPHNPVNENIGSIENHGNNETDFIKVTYN